MNDNGNEFEAQFIRELATLRNRPNVKLELTALAAYCLIGQIQLACRHPANDGHGRDIAEAVARVLINQVATTPALAEVIRRGWDPQYDESFKGGQEK